MMTLPLFADANRLIALLTDYSLLTAHNHYFQSPSDFSLASPSFLTLCVWLITLSVALRYAFIWNKRH